MRRRSRERRHDHVSDTVVKKTKSLGGGIPLLVAESANLKILRADCFTTTNNGLRLSVEGKSARGQTDVLTIRYDRGPGTEMGSGGTTTLQAFVDEGQYRYHRRLITVQAQPNLVEVGSSLSGEKLTFTTRTWGQEPTGSPGIPYQQDFITGYMNPTMVHDRLKALAAEFPSLSDLILLPNLTTASAARRRASSAPPPTRRRRLRSWSWSPRSTATRAATA